MERTLALQNALGVLCYMNTLHPELLSTFSNYKVVLYVEVQSNPSETSIKKILKELKRGLMKDVEITIDFNKNINRDILRLKWRIDREEKK